MSEGIAKTSVSRSPEPVVNKAPAKSFTTDTVHVTPIELYRHFNIDQATSEPSRISELNTIYKYVAGKMEDPTPGKILKAINDLEIRLGAPKIGETRTSKLSRYVQLSKHIEDLESQKEALGYGNELR